MEIEFLYWAECPSHPDALDRLRQVLAEAKLDPPIHFIEIFTEDDALVHQFIGSPTIRVNGVDVDPATADGEPSLTCRIYRLENGRVSPLPSTKLLRRALAHHTKGPI